MSDAERTPKSVYQTEREMRRSRQSFLDALNSMELQILNFDQESPVGRKEFETFLKNTEVAKEKVYGVDNRLLNLTELYERFHPGKKAFLKYEKDVPKKQMGIGVLTTEFRRWIKAEGIKGTFFKGGLRQAMPMYEDEKGAISWQVTAFPPRLLQKQIENSSPWCLFEDVDGKVDTRRILNKTKVIVFGCSVGSNAAEALVEAVGIGDVTLLDRDIQGAGGGGRVSDPREFNNGMLKVVKVQRTLSEKSPYLKSTIYPFAADEEYIERVLRDAKPQDEDGRIVIIEEIDDVFIKDLIRKKVREMYPGNKNVIIISIADIGPAANMVVVEEPGDAPYAGQAFKYDTKDPYVSNGGIKNKNASGLQRVLGKIFATYGLITKAARRPKLEDLGIPPQLVTALNKLMDGEIGSFAQSGLASRLAGVICGQIVLTWIEGHLNKEPRLIDLARMFDNRYKDRKFIKRVYDMTRKLQRRIGIGNFKRVA